MSLMWMLRKWVDPIEQSVEEEARRRQRELIAPEPDDRGGDDPPRVQLPRAVTHYACRICAHESADGAFCPKCLAGTMRPVPPPAR